MHSSSGPSIFDVLVPISGCMHRKQALIERSVSPISNWQQNTVKVVQTAAEPLTLALRIANTL